MGIALGPFAAATLLLTFEWGPVALALAIPGVLATVYGLRTWFDPTAALGEEAETAPSESPSVSEFVSNSRTLFASTFLLVFAIVTCIGLYYRDILTYLPELLNGLPVMEGIEPPSVLKKLSLGDYFYVGLLIAGMAGQHVSGKLTSRVPVAQGLVAIFAVLAVLALAFVPISSMGLVPILVYCTAAGFSLFAIEPFYQEAVAVYTPAKTRGLSYGYTYLGMFGLGAASITIGGFLLDQFSLGVFFASLSLIAVIGAAIAKRVMTGLTLASVRSTDMLDTDD